MIRWLFLFSILLGGCAPKIIQYVNTKAKFGNYRSYVLLPGKSSNALDINDSTNIAWRLENEIKNQMSRRSYLLNYKEPDLILRYDVVSNTESRRQMNPYPFGYYSYFSTMNMQTFTQSAVLIELLDRNTNKLVWQASLDLQNLDKKKRRKDPVAAAVVQLFETYPYLAGQSKPDPTIIE